MHYSLSNSLGRPYVSGLDPDAKAYITAIVAAGATVTGAQKSAISDFVIAEKAASRWTSIKRFYFPVWGVAAANAVDLISLTSGTWVGGVTHAAGYIKGNGSTGYFQTATSLAGIGFTDATQGVTVLIKTAASGTGTATHFGSVDTTFSPFARCQFFIVNANHQGTLGSLVTANDATALFAGVRANITGVQSAVRSSATSLKLFQRKTAGFSTLATNTFNIAGANISSSTTLPTFMAQNAGSVFSDAEYSVFSLHLGMSDANAEAFSLNIKSLYETVTGLTLP